MNWEYLNAIVLLSVSEEESHEFDIHEIHQEISNASILAMELPSGEFKETKIMGFFARYGWECYSVYVPTRSDIHHGVPGAFPKAIFRFKRPS